MLVDENNRINLISKTTIDDIENRHLQNAIMASIYEQQGITDSSTDEDLTHLEAFDDDDDL